MDTAQRLRHERPQRDQDLEQRARALIEGHSHFVGCAGRFEFQFREEVLVVRGSVPTYYLKQVLQSALKDLEGVRLIDNQVAVISSQGLSGPGGA